MKISLFIEHLSVENEKERNNLFQIKKRDTRFREKWVNFECKSDNKHAVSISPIKIPIKLKMQTLVKLELNCDDSEIYKRKWKLKNQELFS